MERATPTVEWCEIWGGVLARRIPYGMVGILSMGRLYTPERICISIVFAVRPASGSLYAAGIVNVHVDGLVHVLNC